MSIAHLNPAQQDAVRYLDGPCLVIAGAGSGKTRVITQKIVRLVEAGVAARNVAAITFTNKAAQEMAERLKPMLRGKSKSGQPLICTFHSLGVRILRGDGSKLGLKRSFSILDSGDATSIINETIGSTDRRAARAVMGQISLWKNALMDPDTAAARASTDDEIRAAQAYRNYAATLRAYQAVDFDDLILLPVKLLAEHEDVAQNWRSKLRYLLIDEYQDTNVCQYELLKSLVGPRAAFTAVGDDDQSIYGWRGATLENLENLGVDYPALKVIKLEQNYRSVQTILTAANQLISLNPKLHEKRLFSELGVGEPIRVIACDSDEAEAESVVMRLQTMKFEKRAKFADFSVLYRGNHQARIFEKALRQARIPYEISGGQSFFERAEIRDVLAYLRLIANDDDDPAFIRAVTTPKRGVGNSTLAALGNYAGDRQCSMFAALFETGFESQAKETQRRELLRFGEFINRLKWRSEREPAGELLDEMISAIDYRNHLLGSCDEKLALIRWQNVCDFVEWIKKRADDDGATLIQIAQSVTLLSQLGNRESDADAVRLSTIHAAKGLEYPHVFVVGCEEGLMPHQGDAPEQHGDEPEGGSGGARIEEERRLMYVAVTRAQRTLTLSWCKIRKRARLLVQPQPSRFIAEMKLNARPEMETTITGSAARGRLGALKAMLKTPDAQ